MKKAIEILDVLHFIECFMYGRYENVTIRYKSGREVFAEQEKIDELKKIGINDISGIWYSVNDERFVIEVK